MTQAVEALANNHLKQVIGQYSQQTKTSKSLAAQYRDVLADKSSLGVQFAIKSKEICYPLTAERANGSQLWDVDGNQYTDILMGLGTNLFGHNPKFVQDAVTEQLTSGFAIGPQSPLVGKTAALISELTGHPRITFSNTGTEAVMTAIRIARTATKRPRIAIFTNSYHGHLDAALVRAPIAEYARKKLHRRFSHTPVLGALIKNAMSTKAVPAFLGVSAACASEILVLEYDNPRSLDILKKQYNDIAAVLVEPVQSRMPELQPKAFLQELRQLTLDKNIALIFDEMVCGFRVAAGGAQEYFGIKADIATYSKITGGGLPLSVIAGSSRYMDHIDGGTWHYGDNSAPSISTTFFAGTFSKHPLSLAAAQATMLHIRDQGPQLYHQLNQKTDRLVQRLNTCTKELQVPITFVSFGSFFAIAMTQSRMSSQAQQLLSYNLLLRGVHLRPGDKGGFLSTAHTEQDIDTIFNAFKKSLSALLDAELLCYEKL